MLLETNDRRLAEYRLDDAPSADRVITDGGAGPRPGVRDQDDPLADAERWGRLLTSSRGPPGCRRGTRRGRNHDRHHGGNDLVLLILIVLVVIDDGNDSNLDIDLLGVVQFDGITLEDLRRGCFGLVRFGVDGGIDRFCRHSGSYVTDG
jgi:hypothetical protein